MGYSNRCVWGSGLFMLFFGAVLYCNPAKSQSVNLSNKKKINLLIVHSFEETLPDYPDFNKFVAEGLKQEKVSVDMQIFHLDCDAYGREEEILRVNNYLDTTFTKPDIVLVTDDQATYSLLASRHPLLKAVPIVFTGVNFPNWDLLKEYPNTTGIWDNPDYEKNVYMIEKLLGIKRIRFFYDRTYNGKKVIERLAEQYKNKDKDLYFSLFNFLQNKDSIQNEKDVDGYNMYLRGNDYSERPIATSLYFINMRDELGSSLLWNISGSFRYSVFLLTKYDYTIAKVGRLATVPTFSAVNKGFTFEQDILGGYFTLIEDQVEATCDYISRIVKGEKVSELPIIEVPKKYVLDWSVLKRWKIPVSEVPKEFAIVNMPFYVKYQAEVIITSIILTITVISVILYLLFLYQREAKRKRQAQLNLWEEKEFLSLAMEGSRIFAWRYNSENNSFTFDKEFRDSVGIHNEILKLKEVTQMTHPNDLEHALTVFINVVNGLGDHGNVRARIDFNGKGYVWYEFRFLNISGVLKEKSSVIGLVMNIQEFKNKEDELTLARDLASKAELKQSFLANMSHEIRTPLNAIVGFSNILVGEEELPNEDKLEYIRIINKNCELLLKLINDILEISRIESGHMSFTFEACNLNDIVEDVYGMCVLQTPPQVEFIKHLPKEPIYLSTDMVKLEQVLANFVNNAFKFTSSGRVTIGIERNEEKKEICLYVEDTGVGISEEDQRMIFNRFYKVDEFVQGTGLGLSVCQAIAEKLNGRLVLSSEKNKGSRFGLVLSYAGEPEKDLHEEVDMLSIATEEIAPQADNLPVVLIAEDSVSNYMVLNNILKKFCTIVWAINGKDAVEIVRKRKIDLVLMDIKMHQMDGITALAKIRKSYKHLPVIIQTAYAFDENRKLAKEAGASGFMVKPISSDILLGVVSDFIHLDSK